MPVLLSIVDTREYSDALRKLKSDIPRYIEVIGLSREVVVRIPKPLVILIVKRGDAAYESIQKHLETSLSQFCAIGKWSRGKTEEGEDYIQFKLLPERVRDGD